MRISRWLLLGVAAGAVQLAGTTIAGRVQPDRVPLDPWAYVLLAAGPAALPFAGRRPLAVLLVAKVSILAYLTIGYPYGPIFLALIAALFATMASGRRIAAWSVLAAGYVLVPWVPYLAGNAPRPPLHTLVALAAWLLVLGLVAEGIRLRIERVAQQRRSREEETRARVAEERVRIAREVHDVLAHNISLMNVQAGVALHLMDERPEHARTALEAIKVASKDTLRELRSILGVLRQVDEPEPLEPAPGLARLDELVARAGDAGLDVRTAVRGEPAAVPAQVDLAAYRIVQEALTNVARHAGPATATVTVGYEDDVLTVEIDDDGRGPTGGANGGRGLAGMRERAQALGGVLETGRRPGGGFRVRARLPL